MTRSEGCLARLGGIEANERCEAKVMKRTSCNIVNSFEWITSTTRSPLVVLDLESDLCQKLVV